MIVTLKIGEAIKLTDDITIMLVDTKTNLAEPQAKLGVKAPRHIRVDRQEVHERIKAQIEEVRP